MSDTLFSLPQPYPPRKGHAADPGTGPAGETCGSCDHYTTMHHYGGKTFPKCYLMKMHWTSGPGSDIRKKDPACRMWKEADDATE